METPYEFFIKIALMSEVNAEDKQLIGEQLNALSFQGAENILTYCEDVYNRAFRMMRDRVKFFEFVNDNFRNADIEVDKFWKMVFFMLMVYIPEDCFAQLKQGCF